LSFFLFFSGFDVEGDEDDEFSEFYDEGDE